MRILHLLPFWLVAKVTKDYCNSQLKVYGRDNKPEYWQFLDLDKGFGLSYSPEKAEAYRKTEEEAKERKLDKFRKKFYDMINKQRYNLTKSDKKNIIKQLAQDLPIKELEESIKEVIDDRNYE